MKIGCYRLLAALVVCWAVGTFSSSGSADEFPKRQVTIVVPFAPGASVDIVARTLATKIASRWGQPVIVDNRPGASTTLASKYVAEAKPDGHTLFFTTSDTFTIIPSLTNYRSFKPTADLAPVNLLANLVNGIISNPSLPVATLAELIAYAKANPGELRYSSPGAGSNIHLAMEMFKAQAKIEIQHVPYRGLAPATTAVLSNEVQLSMAGYSARQLVESGKIKMIAIAGPERFPAFPNIPTTAELGYQKADSSTLLTLAAPIKTPRDILAKINEDVGSILNDPDVRRELVEARGLAILNLGLQAAAAELESRSRLGAEMVKIAGLDQE